MVNFNLTVKKWDNGVDESGTMLPSISLIITYINEPRSTLLRTIVSVYERTSPNLLKEIILVDDNNEDKTVGKELKVSQQSLNINAKHFCWCFIEHSHMNV